jgi:hypothetical protein
MSFMSFPLPAGPSCQGIDQYCLATPVWWFGGGGFRGCTKDDVGKGCTRGNFGAGTDYSEEGECVSIPWREMILFGSAGRVRVMKRVSFVIYVGKRKGMWVMMWHFIMHMQEDVAIVKMPMGGTPKYSNNNTNLTNTCPSIGPQEPSRPVPTGSSIPSSNLPSSLKKN